MRLNGWQGRKLPGRASSTVDLCQRENYKLKAWFTQTDCANLQQWGLFLASAASESLVDHHILVVAGPGGWRWPYHVTGHLHHTVGWEEQASRYERTWLANLPS